MTVSVHRSVNQAVADGLRVLTVLDDRLAVIRDAQRGQPGAQRYDGGRGGSVSLWCDLHEREVRECEEADLDCDGQTIELHDPTGEAAMKGDRARDALRLLERQADAAARAMDAIVNELGRWGVAVVVNDRAGIGNCDDCGHRCDGGKDRLRPSANGEHRYCDTCRKRESRFKPQVAS